MQFVHFQHTHIEMLIFGAFDASLLSSSEIQKKITVT
jgi:hypothetical protein